MAKEKCLRRGKTSREKWRGRIQEDFGQFWSRLGVIAVTEYKWFSLTRSLIIVSRTEKLGPTESSCLEPTVVLWMWSLDQVWLYEKKINLWYQTIFILLTGIHIIMTTNDDWYLKYFFVISEYTIYLILQDCNHELLYYRVVKYEFGSINSFF